MSLKMRDSFFSTVVDDWLICYNMFEMRMLEAD